MGDVVRFAVEAPLTEGEKIRQYAVLIDSVAQFDQIIADVAGGDACRQAVYDMLRPLLRQDLFDAVEARDAAIARH